MEDCVAVLRHCSNNHDQVSFFADACPVCEIVAVADHALEVLRGEIEKLQDRVGKES